MTRVLQPAVEGYARDAGAARYAASSTAPRAFRKPAPCVNASYPGYGCAVYCRMALTALGVSAGFAWSINATVAATTGADMLVPLRLRYGKYEVGTVPAISFAPGLA